MKRHRCLTFAFSAMLILLSSHSARAQCDPGEAIIKLGYASTQRDDAQARAANTLRAVIDRDLQGKACLQALNFSLNYADDKVVGELAAGRLQIAMPSHSVLGQIASAWRAFSAPFAFRDLLAAEAFFASPASAALRGVLEPSGVTALATLHVSLEQMATAKSLVWPRDIRGMRLWRGTDDFNSALADALDAASSPSPLADLSAAFIDGSISVATGNWTFLEALKLDTKDVSLTQTNHRYRGREIAVSGVWWSKLKPDLKQPVAKAIQQAAVQVNRETRAKNNAARGALIAKDIVVRALTSRQRKRWLEALSTLRVAVDAPLEVALRRANALP